MPIRNLNDLSPIEDRPKPPPGGGGGEGGGEKEEQPDKESEEGEGEGEDEEKDEENKNKSKPSPNKPPKENDKSKSSGSDEEEDYFDDDDLGPGEPEDSNSGGDDDEEDEQDALERKIEDLLAQRKESDGSDAPPKKLDPPKDIKTSSGKDMTKVKEVPIPVFDWKTIISRFVKTAPPPGELSYTKADPRSATQIHIGSQLGAAPIKPGFIKSDAVKFNLFMVFDSSGSMASTIEQALAETGNLLNQQAKNVGTQIGVIFYSDRVIFKAGDLSRKEFWDITDVKDLKKSPPPSVPKQSLKEILSTKTTGATIFNSALASQIGGAAAAGYNVIMFSDRDILDGSNWKNFVSLFRAHGKRLFFIADNLPTYQAVITKLGIRSKDLPMFGVMDKKL